MEVSVVHGTFAKQPTSSDAFIIRRMGNYCLDKCIDFMDTFGRTSGGIVHGMNGPANFHYVPFMDDLEAGLVEMPQPPAEPAPQAAPLQEPVMYGSSTDVFT